MTTAQQIIKNGWNTTEKFRKPEWEPKYAGTASDTVKTGNGTTMIKA